MDDMWNDPALLARVIDGTPDINAHPRKDAPAEGDLAKFYGELRMYAGGKWRG